MTVLDSDSSTSADVLAMLIGSTIAESRSI